MKPLRIAIFSLILFAVFYLLGVLSERLADIPRDELVNKLEIESKVEEKLNILDKYFQELELITESKNQDSVFVSFLTKNKEILDKNHLSVLVFSGKELKYWSNRKMSIDKPLLETDTIYFAEKPNGWYLIVNEKHSDLSFKGALLLKRKYNYENKFLPEYIPEFYKLPDGVEFVANQSVGVPVHVNSEYKFSINADNEVSNKAWFDLSLVFYALSFLFLLISIYYSYNILSVRVKYPLLLVFALIVDIAVLRFLMIRYDLPGAWMMTDLFSPAYYGESNINDSLGGLLVNSIFLVFFALTFHRFFITGLKKNISNILQVIISITIVSFSCLLLYFALYQIKGLIVNSSISLDFNHLLGLTTQSFLGLFIGILLILSVYIMIDRIVLLFRDKINKKYFYYSYVFIAIALFFVAYLFYDNKLLNLSILSLIVISWIVFWVRFEKRRFNYYAWLLLLMLMSLFVTIYFNSVLEQKKENESKVMAMNLSNERDAGAEYFIKQINSDIKKDSMLIKMMGNGDIEASFDRFYRLYMKGYLEKYDVQLTYCSDNDSLILQPDNETMHCRDYFQTMIDLNGIKLIGTDFYYLDNNNGRISYFGKIPVYKTDSISSNLYIEVESRIYTEGPGYPELLLDKSLMPRNFSSEFSYAKYYSFGLIIGKGDYNYPEYYKPEKDTAQFKIFYENGFKHTLYRLGGDSFIIVSAEKKSLKSYSIFFTYIFFILFVLVNLVYVSSYLYNRVLHTNSSFNLKNRFRAYLLMILSVSIILIGIVSIIFYVNKYRDKQKDTIYDKMRSIEVELNHKLGQEEALDSTMSDYLNFLLVKFSNVFYTDINLFDLDGKLLASSRMEIYDQGLIGKRMYPDAYLGMQNNRGYFVENEEIGDMKYLSAYVVFENEAGKDLAYINLPYFARQQDFSEEISDLTVTVLNVYLILFILTILIAIFTSNQLTRPLRMLEESIRKMDISRKSNKIQYDRDDEIGSLVKEYNKKVEELALSAEKLAKSEREYAWREMAKQIAHEIKNPLTPMKLSVQHLQKSFEENDPDAEKMFEKVSKNLIEQIDVLSTIATEFSNFAKIRMRKKEPVDLAERIKRAQQLYSGISSTIIESKIEADAPAMIMADNEQVMRFFNNLIKNSMQAIPDNRDGIIMLGLKDMGDYYLVSVADNGKGIKEDAQERIFLPNFTTKTSGMGLGLSIVKGIVDNMDGMIYFETGEDKGTTFFIEIPKMFEE